MRIMIEDVFILALLLSLTSGTYSSPSSSHSTSRSFFWNMFGVVVVAFLQC